MEPTYKTPHDGNFLGAYRAHDLYFWRAQDHGPIIVARFGNGPGDYVSCPIGMLDGERDPILREGVTRARSKGLLG